MNSGDAPRNAPTLGGSIIGCGRSMLVGPRFEVAFPPPHASRRESDWLREIAISNTPADRRFAKAGRCDHVVKPKEATARACHAAAFATGHGAIARWIYVGSGHERSPFDGLGSMGSSAGMVPIR